MKKKLSTVLLALAAFMPMTAQNLVKGDYGYLYCHMSDKGEWTAYADFVMATTIRTLMMVSLSSILQSMRVSKAEPAMPISPVCIMAKDTLWLPPICACAKSHKWDNYGIDLLKSNDLMHWTSVTFDFRKGMQNFCDAATATVSL